MDEQKQPDRARIPASFSEDEWTVLIFALGVATSALEDRRLKESIFRLADRLAVERLDTWEGRKSG